MLEIYLRRGVYQIEPLYGFLFVVFCLWIKRRSFGQYLRAALTVFIVEIMQRNASEHRNSHAQVRHLVGILVSQVGGALVQGHHRPILTNLFVVISSRGFIIELRNDCESLLMFMRV